MKETSGIETGHFVLTESTYAIYFVLNLHKEFSSYKRSLHPTTAFSSSKHIFTIFFFSVATMAFFWIWIHGELVQTKDWTREPVLCIRIRHNLYGPDPSINKKKSKKTLISTILWLLFDFLSLKTDVNVHWKNNKQ